MMHMQMSYDVFYSIPVKIRSWFIDRLIKYKSPKPDSVMSDMDTPLAATFKNT
jgi:hypothetical protein